MRGFGKASAILKSAALACLLSTDALADKTSGWHGDTTPRGTSLFYGTPQSGDAPISFTCAPGGNGLTFVLSFIPGDSIDSADVDVLLQAGSITVPIRATGMHRGMSSRLFVLEARISLDDRLADLITSDGTLVVSVDGRMREYPLEGARAAAAPLLKHCTGKTADSGKTNATICRMRAWSTDPDPAGHGVRAGPGPEYAVIGRLPPPQKVGDTAFATEVSIVGSQDGWFRINAATINNYVVENGPDIVFEGDGWISGRFLGLSVEGSHLFAEPSSHAPIAFDLHRKPKRPQGPDASGLELERLHACKGNWAEVGVTAFGRRGRGWTKDICSSQVTTCP